MEKLPKNTKIYKLQNNETWIKFFLMMNTMMKNCQEIITFLYDNIGEEHQRSRENRIIEGSH